MARPRWDAMKRKKLIQKYEWIGKRKSTTTCAFNGQNCFHFIFFFFLIFFFVFVVCSCCCCCKLHAIEVQEPVYVCMHEINTCNRRRVHLLSVLNCLTTNSYIMAMDLNNKLFKSMDFFFCLIPVVSRACECSIPFMVAAMGNTSVLRVNTCFNTHAKQFKPKRRKRKRNHYYRKQRNFVSRIERNEHQMQKPNDKFFESVNIQTHIIYLYLNLFDIFIPYSRLSSSGARQREREKRTFRTSDYDMK